MNGAEGFVFVDSPADFLEKGALVVRIPCRIRSKEKLLSILAEKLKFPGYFGWNWDALEECLGDLTWLPAGQGVVIVHEDLPFGPGGENRAIYLSILSTIAEHWSGEASDGPARRLQVVFPTTCQPHPSSN